jgi:prepilin-type N-terminal cleavage/methylation domain-containing protein
MTQRRRGFTLVELLVALALTLFILAILSECFVTGADTFRTLKSIGDLNASLRNAVTILRSDLAADHFEGKRRVSDSTFWTQGPPTQGYFYLFQGQDPAPVTSDPLYEGVDADGIISRRRVTHQLAFTVRAKGTRPQDFFTANVPTTTPTSPLASLPHPDGGYPSGTLFSSQWIEVCYFLSPIQSGVTTTDGTGTVKLYALYRQQRLVLGDNTSVTWTAANRVQATAANMLLYQPVFSCKVNPQAALGNFIYFNSPADLTIPQRRAAGNFTPPTATFTPLVNNLGQQTGDDLLLTDVLSFDVKVLTKTNTGTALGTDTDFGTLPNPYYYDTWSRRQDLQGPNANVYDYASVLANGNFRHPVPTAPSAASTAIPAWNVVALQITLRVWDPRTKLSRQITIVQDI